MVFVLTHLASRVCLCFVCVLGGGSGVPTRRSNPSRDTGSKRLRNQEDVPEGSNAPKRNVKTTASKYKEPSKGMDEIPLAEFVSRRKINPYRILVQTSEGMNCSGPSSRISFTWM